MENGWNQIGFARAWRVATRRLFDLDGDRFATRFQMRRTEGFAKETGTKETGRKDGGGNRNDRVRTAVFRFIVVGNQGHVKHHLVVFIGEGDAGRIRGKLIVITRERSKPFVGAKRKPVGVGKWRPFIGGSKIGSGIDRKPGDGVWDQSKSGGNSNGARGFEVRIEGGFVVVTSS